MWIAKNDLTGKTYGKEFKSVYDCQDYINKELAILQFLYGVVLGLEFNIDDDENYKKWLSKKDLDDSSLVLEIAHIIQYGVEKLMYGLPPNPRNNVIRCYNVEQERFADGFDF